MTDRTPVSTLVFDVNETLLDITTLEPLFERLFGTSGTLREWFAEMILYSQTLTLSGRYMPFGALAGGVLRMVGDNKSVVVRDDDIAELKVLFGTMPAYPDVVPALSRLRDAGFTLVTLTNSAPGQSPTPMERAGIASLFDHHFSVDAVKRFKPHPATYELVTNRLGVTPQAACMVACHLWDTIGAQCCGYTGAFVARPHNSIVKEAQVPQPDIVARDLDDFASQIIAAHRPVG